MASIPTGFEGMSLAARSRKSFCEFFAGIGLVREGLAGSGWSCIYANDIDPKKQQLYEGRFGSGSHFHLGDVWKCRLSPDELDGEPFLATASFPCVDLSLAGHWQGLGGRDSSTFFGFTRILGEMGRFRPKLVLIENVVGFISSQDGRDFQTAARSLAELGYWLDAFVLDARGFVPQSRPRVFVVGVHHSIDPPMVVRKSASDWVIGDWEDRVRRANRSMRPHRLRQLMASTDLPTGWAAFDIPAPGNSTHGVADVIDLDESQDWWDEQAVAKHYSMMSDRHRKRIDALLQENGPFVGTIFRRKREGKTRAEVRFDGVAGCLRTPRGGSARQIVIVIDRGKLRMRWMSPREYARLQGADDYPLVSNTIQNLYGFGDAVCVPVIRWIDRHVLTPVFEWAESVPREGGRGGQLDPGAAPPRHAGGQRQEHVA